jgi:hypothetical protein
MRYYNGFCRLILQSEKMVTCWIGSNLKEKMYFKSIIQQIFLFSNPHPLPLSQGERGARSVFTGLYVVSYSPRPLGEGLGVRV